MPADPRVYDSERLARCYAHTRPPVHPAICARLFAALPEGGRPVRSAWDLGCGAGASTAALLGRCDQAVGIDPSLPMLRQARDRVPAAAFAQASAVALPARTATVDLVTAAGSLNYTDVDASLAEAARVLAPGGHLAVYDFSTGRVLPADAGSEVRFQRFKQRFPSSPGYALDLARLPFDRHGLALTLHETFVVEVGMTEREYIDYMLGETNVEAVIAAGLDEARARQACVDIFGALFEGGSRRAVGFAAELALATRESPS